MIAPKVTVGVFGRGLAYLLGLGAIVLAYTNNDSWQVFLGASLVVFFVPIFLNHGKKKPKRRKKR